MHRLVIAVLIGLAITSGHALAQSGGAQSIDTLYAEAQAAKAKGDNQAAIGKLQAILKINPQLAPVYHNLGVLYFEQGKLQEAAQAFERGLQIDGSMTSSLLPLGLSYYQLNRLDKARTVLQKAIQAKPDDPTAQLYLGRAMFDSGQQEEGARVLQDLVRQAPNDERALYELGEMHLKMGQGVLKKLETRAPDSYLVHLFHAQMMESMENYEGALVQYRKAAEKQPSLPYAHYNIGNVYWLMQRWEDAKPEFKREIAANPYDCLAYGQLGNIVVRTHGDRKEARSYIDRALELCPDLPQARTDYGLLLAEDGKFEKAIAQYKRAIELNPQDDGVHLLLGRAYQKLGRADEAKVEYATAQNLQKKNSEREQIRRQDVGSVQ